MSSRWVLLCMVCSVFIRIDAVNDIFAILINFPWFNRITLSQCIENAKVSKKCDYMMISLAYGVYYIHSTHVKYGRLSWIAFFVCCRFDCCCCLLCVYCMHEGSTKWILFVRCYFVTCALQLSLENELANQIESAKCCKIISLFRFCFVLFFFFSTNDTAVKNRVLALICRWELCQNICVRQ